MTVFFFIPWLFGALFAVVTAFVCVFRGEPAMVTLAWSAASFAIGTALLWTPYIVARAFRKAGPSARSQAEEDNTIPKPSVD